MIKVGDRHKAMGQVMDLWTLAQAHWFPNRDLIPEPEFHAADLLEALIETGLAERRDDGIYAKGSEDAFEWLFQKQSAGHLGGVASAKQRQARAKQTSSAAKHIQPSYSSSISSSKTINTETVSFLANEQKEAFETYWSGVPNRVGKSKAEASFAKCLKKFSIADILTAHQKMKTYKDQTGEAYPHPATFLNNLSDYLQPDYGKINQRPQVNRYSKPEPKPVNQNSTYRERDPSQYKGEVAPERIGDLLAKAGLRKSVS